VLAQLQDLALLVHENNVDQEGREKKKKKRYTATKLLKTNYRHLGGHTAIHGRLAACRPLKYHREIIFR
jgi:hypothetical protein